jgi:L-Ala-D/L-Glu epimerase
MAAGVFLWCMALQLSIARYRLLFHEPFRTSHGERDGTDAVFVRLERNGRFGFGEATMPPYVRETADTVVAQLQRLDLAVLEQGEFPAILNEHPAARAAISTAYYDLLSKDLKGSIESVIDVRSSHMVSTWGVVTLGAGAVERIASKVQQLEAFNGLKVKLTGQLDELVVDQVLTHDHRPLLLDANQAWSSVEQALSVLDRVPAERLLGLEQPFPVDRPDLQEALRAASQVTVYGDESIAGMADLEANRGLFSGVNLKLMKCGGLYLAVAMAQRAQELGMKVMLGCMSESSLGCGAMLALSGLADVVDLDGPWLIRNDPFTGVELRSGCPVRAGTGHGIGVQEAPGSQLHWTPIGA